MVHQLITAVTTCHYGVPRVHFGREVAEGSASYTVKTFSGRKTMYTMGNYHINCNHILRVWMYVRIPVCVWLYVRAYTCLCVVICACVYLSGCGYMCVRIPVCVWLYVRAYTFLCAVICACVYISVCCYMCVRACVLTCFMHTQCRKFAHRYYGITANYQTC